MGAPAIIIPPPIIPIIPIVPPHVRCDSCGPVRLEDLGEALAIAGGTVGVALMLAILAVWVLERFL